MIANIIPLIKYWKAGLAIAAIVALLSLGLHYKHVINKAQQLQVQLELAIQDTHEWDMRVKELQENTRIYQDRYNELLEKQRLIVEKSARQKREINQLRKKRNYVQSNPDVARAIINDRAQRLFKSIACTTSAKSVSDCEGQTTASGGSSASNR